jgi:hypothetical protein
MQGLATEEELVEVREHAKIFVREARDKAWKAYNEPINLFKDRFNAIIEVVRNQFGADEAIALLLSEYSSLLNPLLKRIGTHSPAG